MIWTPRVTVHLSFPILEPVCCSMTGSNCCFLTCIYISQEAGKVVWHSHFYKNLLQFVVIHTFKCFTIVNEAEVDVFLEFSCCFCNSMDVGKLISGSSALLNPTCSSESSRFKYCWSLAWRILSTTWLAWEVSATVRWFEHSLVLPFLVTRMKTDLF